ncbi:MAG: SIS domain-containing protein [Gemmatimonadota bacterium]|nr:SIS domain-containing protein [Gemmatimonadota bacterium]
MSRAAAEAVRLHLEGLAEAAAAAAAAAVASEAAAYAGRAAATLEAGGRLLFCGNGGSAATAEHVATEYVVRLRRSRAALPATALTAGSAQLTAAANDLGFERAFVRILEAAGRRGDLLVLHSTSGESPNLLAAARAARDRGIGTVALLGARGGRLAPLVDLAIRVPADEPQRVQELHLAIEHAVVGLVEERFAAVEEDR